MEPTKGRERLIEEVPAVFKSLQLGPEFFQQLAQGNLIGCMSHRSIKLRAEPLPGRELCSASEAAHFPVEYSHPQAGQEPD